MKINFSEQELIQKGFIEQEDGGSRYFIYLLDPEDFINSKFLASTDEGEVEGYQIISPYNTGDESEILTEDQINDIITRGQF